MRYFNRTKFENLQRKIDFSTLFKVKQRHSAVENIKYLGGEGKNQSFNKGPQAILQSRVNTAVAIHHDRYLGTIEPGFERRKRQRSVRYQRTLRVCLLCNRMNVDKSENYPPSFLARVRVTREIRNPLLRRNCLFCLRRIYYFPPGSPIKARFIIIKKRYSRKFARYN